MPEKGILTGTYFCERSSARLPRLHTGGKINSRPGMNILCRVTIDNIDIVLKINFVRSVLIYGQYKGYV